MDAGVPVIRGTNLPDHRRFSFDDFVFVSEEKVQRDLRGNLAFPGDLVVTQRGTLGQVGLIPRSSPYDKLVLSQSQMKLSVDLTVANPSYVYYALRSPSGQHEIRSRAITAGVPHINLTLFEELRIPLPPLPTQRKIAAILSAYDDLIENNTRRIEILEEMGQRFYREWFVDFRYPGHESVPLVDSEPEPIPLDWKRVKLKDVATIIMGQSPKSEFYNETGDGLPFHQGVTNFGRMFPTHRLFSTAGNRRAQNGDILFSVRAPVGRINIADCDLILGRGVAAIRPHVAPAFFLAQLQDTFYEEDLLGNGAIFASVTRADVEGIPVLVPSDEVLARYELMAHPLYDSLALLTQITDNLRATRDLLLPRLISGEIDVDKLNIEVPDAA